MASSLLTRKQVMDGPEVDQSGNWTASRSSSISRILPGPVLVLLSIVFAQLGAATAKTLLATHSACSIVFLRLGFAAIMLWLVEPPRVRLYSKRQWFYAAALGIVMVGLSLAFYQSVSRIPLGITMTIEFLGPFMVALAASRKAQDVLWPLLALAGILLLAPIGNLRSSSLSLAGIAFAFLAAIAWGAYLVLAKRTTAIFSGTTGLTMAMTVATAGILPFGLISGGKSLLDLNLLVSGFWVSVLSTIIPFSLEFLALKRMSPRTFGILISGEPSVAALVGVVMLHEQLGFRAWAALAFVSIAMLGVMSQDAKSLARTKLQPSLQEI